MSEADHVLGFLLNTNADIIREATAVALRPFGLSPRDVGMLRRLQANGVETQRRLGQLHMVDRTTTAQCLARFESSGLIRRVRDPADGRAFLVTLTATGKKTVADASRVLDRVENTFVYPLSDSERDVLKGLLTRLLEHEANAGDDSGADGSDGTAERAS